MFDAVLICKLLRGAESACLSNAERERERHTHTRAIPDAFQNKCLYFASETARRPSPRSQRRVSLTRARAGDNQSPGFIREDQSSMWAASALPTVSLGQEVSKTKVTVNS